jgi:3-isopropylmalate/(R)-2-methylmalate dehydratase large subunit
VGMTMIEKILSRHSEENGAQPGDIAVCEVDMAVLLDLSFSTAGRIELIPTYVRDPDQVAIILDHTIPAPSVHDAEGHKRAREFAAEFGIDRFFDVGNHGICHQVILENGLALPGQILACSDSHTIASGALNCAARGLGPIEILQIICTGKTWFKVTPTIKFVLEGEKPPNVFGKDIFLYIAGEFGSAEGHNVEFAGEGLKSMTMDDRSTLSTMCAEISAEFALFPADDLVLEYLEGITDEEFEPATSDPDAEYAAVHTIDLSEIEPYVARPDFVPKNTEVVDHLGERISIDQAFVGSCANGKLEDLRIAAAIVRGRKVSPGVRFLVTPASQSVYKDAARLGYVETLVEAGAVVTNSTCGACYGGHMGVVGPGEVCLTSSTRNFKGRMGSPDAKIYIASSATVAASAVEGYITDPTPYLEGVGAA